MSKRQVDYWLVLMKDWTNHTRAIRNTALWEKSKALSGLNGRFHYSSSRIIPINHRCSQWLKQDLWQLTSPYTSVSGSAAKDTVVTLVCVASTSDTCNKKQEVKWKFYWKTFTPTNIENIIVCRKGDWDDKWEYFVNRSIHLRVV